MKFIFFIHLSRQSIILKISIMPNTSSLEQQIIQLNHKLKVICHQYLKIKDQLALKCLQIQRLTQENQTLKKKQIIHQSPSPTKYSQINLHPPQQKNHSKLHERVIDWVKPPKTESLISSRQYMSAGKKMRKNLTSFHSSFVPSRNRKECLEKEEKEIKFSGGENYGELDETESLILREIWKERDREINRMNELFDDLNRRIAEIQQ